MRSPFSPGDAVRARGRVWRLRDVTEHDDCVELRLERIGAATATGPTTVLVHPFDRVSLVPNPDRPGFVSCRALWRTLAHRASQMRAFDALVSPAAAALDILPYQLEPTIALVLNGAPRVLVADAVGLGKTVQAGIVLAESFARGHAARALVLVPAALRDQWFAELRTRFGLDVAVVDAQALRTAGSNLPRTVSPWMVPRVAIVSIDFAKRAEVRADLAAVPWDLVVVDEAHAATLDSDRYHLADLLARRAKGVVLLTATPHSGDDEAFAALTRLGAATPTEPLVFFRRSRAETRGPSARRSRLLGVRLGPAERASLRLLLGYLRAVWETAPSARPSQARLMAILLLKRALSSPDSLLRSIVRRRALLCLREDPAAAQLLLPMDDDTDPADDEPVEALGAPGLPSRSEEMAWLDQIAAAAAVAARESRKFEAVARLVRRAREPLIVFTEYRDTLAALEHWLRHVAGCALLHGGLGRAERHAALSAFTDGGADVLLATDAAGVGLNLHQRCRTVVNLEVPWNPVRLEQRLGRVDRLGQTRAVHAIHLVGRATPEERVLARLARRAARATAALADASSPFVFDLPPGDEATAEALLGIRSRPAVGPATRTGGGAHLSVPALQRWDLAIAAETESVRQHHLRRLHAALRTDGTPYRGGHRARGVMVAAARPGRRHSPILPAPGGCLLVVFEHCLVDSTGRVVDEWLFPFAVTDVRLRRPPSGMRAFARSLARTIADRLGPHAEHAARQRAADAGSHLAAARGAMRARLLALARDADDTGTAPPAQPGLFDRRTEHDAERALAKDAAWVAMRRRHAGADASAAEFRARPPQLKWVFVQWPSSPPVPRMTTRG